MQNVLLNLLILKRSVNIIPTRLKKNIYIFIYLFYLDRSIDRQTDRQTDGQTDRQTDR